MENATMLEARCRSREGAWIEILGLNTEKYYELSRSREGAWIEILLALLDGCYVASRSRKGAWIEIKKDCMSCHPDKVAPVRERGLKLLSLHQYSQTAAVAPARERGLKYQQR